VLRDERVQPLDPPLDTASSTGRPLVAERVQQVDARGGARRDLALGPDEMPRSEALLLGHQGDECRRRLVLERQQPDSLTAVEGRDGTRREAAEPSASIVEDHGS
jgi:hypothetical protein